MMCMGIGICFVPVCPCLSTSNCCLDSLLRRKILAPVLIDISQLRAGAIDLPRLGLTQRVLRQQRNYGLVEHIS